MTDTVREYRRNVSAQALGRVLYVLGGALTFIGATHAMTVDALADYALALTLLTIVWALADLGTTATLGVHVAAAAEQDRGTIIGAFLVMRIGLAALAGAVGALAAPFILGPSMLPMVWVACALTPLLAARFYEPVFQVADRPHLSGVLGILYFGVLVPLAAVALILLPERPDLLLGAHLLAGIAYTTVGLWLMHRLVPLGWPRSLGPGRLMLQRSALIGCSSLLSVLNLRSGTLVLKFLAGPEAVALFVAAQRFLELGAAVAVTVSTPLFSIFGRLAKAGRSGATAVQVLTLTLALAVPVPVLALVWSEPVVRLLYGADLHAAAALVPFMAAQFLLFTVGVALGPAILATFSIKRLSLTLVGPALALVVNLGLCLILVPLHGSMGAAFAAVAGEAMVATVVVTLFFVATRQRIRLRALLGIAAGAAMLALVLLGLPDVPVLLRTLLGLVLYAGGAWVSLRFIKSSAEQCQGERVVGQQTMAER